MLYRYEQFLLLAFAEEKKTPGKRKAESKEVTLVDKHGLLHMATSPLITYTLDVESRDESLFVVSILDTKPPAKLSKNKLIAWLVLERQLPRKQIVQALERTPKHIESLHGDVLTCVPRENRHYRAIVAALDGVLEHPLRYDVAQYFGAETARHWPESELEIGDVWRFCFATALYYPEHASDRCSTSAFRRLEKLFDAQSGGPEPAALELYERFRREFELYGKTRFVVADEDRPLVAQLVSQDCSEALVALDDERGIYTFQCVARVNARIDRALHALCPNVASARLNMRAFLSESNLQRVAVLCTAGWRPSQYYPWISDAVVQHPHIESVLVLTPDPTCRRVVERYTGMTATVYRRGDRVRRSPALVILDRLQHWSYWTLADALERLVRAKASRIILLGDNVQTPPKPCKGQPFLDMYRARTLATLTLDLKLEGVSAARDAFRLKCIADALRAHPEAGIDAKHGQEREKLLKRWSSKDTRPVELVSPDALPLDESPCIALYSRAAQRDKSKQRVQPSDMLWLSDTGYVHCVTAVYSGADARNETSLPHASIRVDPPELRQHTASRECCGLDAVAGDGWRRMALHSGEKLTPDGLLWYQLGNPETPPDYAVALHLDEHTDLGILYNVLSRKHKDSNVFLVGTEADLSETLQRSFSSFPRSTCLSDYLCAQNNARNMMDIVSYE